MPGRHILNKFLSEAVKAKCDFAFIETTSEGVAQNRHKFINFQTAVITNLNPEHIEAHGSFENYKQAKGKFFAAVPGTHIINIDDKYADYFLSFWAEEKIVFTEKEDAMWPNIKILHYQKTASQSPCASLHFNGVNINLRLLGEFNIANAMSALSSGVALSLTLATIKRGLEDVHGIPGRLEMVDVGQDFIVIVDYAFEPHAVAKLYETVANIAHRQIIHVIGSAGGGRDIARRPMLGRLAGQSADYVIVTNEDPYDDDPEIIIDQVALGAEKEGKKDGVDLFKILDRGKAITKAIDLAQSSDIVLITGKGSEQAICTADGKKIPWDDRQVTRKIIKNKLETARMIVDN